MTESDPRATKGRFRNLVHWLLYCVCAVTAALGTISVESVVSGRPAVGAMEAFGLSLLLVGLPAWFLASTTMRHRFFARLLTAYSIFGVLGLFVLRGKAATLRSTGQPAVDVSFGPTLTVLLIQLGLAVFYLWWSRQECARPAGRRSSVPWWSWGPVALFVPLLLIGGLAGSQWFGWGSGDSSADGVTEPAQEKYSRFPKPEDFEFAQETARAGEDAGGQFIHYHTGQRPVVGFTFSNRKWMRHVRIADDLRAIFDRDAPREGEQAILAKPGYFVAGVQAQVDEHVHTFRVEFAPRDDWGGLDMFDAYWSDWSSGFQPGIQVVELGGTGDPVLGVTGTSGLVVNSMGLMIATSAYSSALD